MDREREIVKASVFGIIGNMLLVAFKMAVGFISGSIAIILDGINNATDALSSIITIVGTKLAGRKPDRKHPFGYGRIEYLTSVVIAIIILAAGVLSLRESIDKIVNPGTPSYSTLTIVVIVVAIVAKIGIGFMFKHYGDKTNSGALVASGIDSNYDAVLSAGTLVVAFAQNLWGVNIDGIVGLVISLVVCKAGFDVMRDALGPIIGVPEARETVAAIEECARSFPEVKGVYDVVLDDFGPNRALGSVHIEVPDNLTARQIHELTRKLSEKIYRELGIITTIGIYAENTTGEFAPMRTTLKDLVDGEPGVKQMHGFYVDADERAVTFDLMVDFEEDDEAVVGRIVKALADQYPGFDFDVQVDRDYMG